MNQNVSIAYAEKHNFFSIIVLNLQLKSIFLGTIAE